MQPPLEKVGHEAVPSYADLSFQIARDYIACRAQLKVCSDGYWTRALKRIVKLG
jgi:hypothetical protein